MSALLQPDFVYEVNDLLAIVQRVLAALQQRSQNEGANHKCDYCFLLYTACLTVCCAMLKIVTLDRSDPLKSCASRAEVITAEAQALSQTPLFNSARCSLDIHPTLFALKAHTGHLMLVHVRLHQESTTLNSYEVSSRQAVLEKV